MRQKPTPKKPVVQDPRPEVTSPADNRQKWYTTLLIVGVLLLAGSALSAMMGWLSGIERQVFDFINHAYLPNWVADQIAKPMSNAVWGMVILVGALLAIPKFRLLAWQYSVAAGATYVAVFIAEHVVDRARPVALESYDAIVRASQGGPGFPSGHVAVLMALGLTIWPLVSWPWRTFILILIGVEAWARMYLGLHTPLDIVGAAGISMTAVAVIHLLPGKIRKFFRLAR